MIAETKKKVLGVFVDATDYATAVARVLEAARASRSLGVSALAVHGVMTGALDSVHRYRLNHLDLVVPDGQPVRWALNLLHGAGLEDRVYGPTLMLELCRAAAAEELPVFLFGSSEQVLERLSDNLCGKFPGLQIAGVRPSAFGKVTPAERDAVVRQITDSGAALTFVGLGCPRQEVWAYEHLQHLAMPLIAVGAAFDFHAGLLPQAPAAFQRHGLEWLYRLVREPGRLWRRYLLLNPAGLALLAAQASGLSSIDPEGTPPDGEIRYG